ERAEVAGPDVHRQRARARERDGGGRYALPRPEHRAHEPDRVGIRQLPQRALVGEVGDRGARVPAYRAPVGGDHERAARTRRRRGGEHEAQGHHRRRAVPRAPAHRPTSASTAWRSASYDSAACPGAPPPAARAAGNTPPGAGREAPISSTWSPRTTKAPSP